MTATAVALPGVDRAPRRLADHHDGICQRPGTALRWQAR
ncbi:hypothetical protein TVNIR_2685 [Thioalkalivibrio nitratireducens DSM 14787]|uniref:Uncharacterized protein n=1 Tax=Thioalkalivibrio nitratireducens (strain DSM 14787 / UNIQEM 213 / ALEN2) TaxID=1255043 RepID=L0E0Z8_THIND|nr:hypothetical protein TVNIR_2685 [Thioalkalivibrio nitratireducens DSM 14787]